MATKTAAVDAKGYRKFGFRDVLAYGLGDFGCNMSFALKGTLTIFWTQYMGIDSILMASLLLLVQVWDAINDPVIGAMVDADKRQYKRNKFLAYIWAGSVGLLVAGALCFVPWTGAPYVVKCILFVTCVSTRTTVLRIINWKAMKPRMPMTSAMMKIRSPSRLLLAS